MNNPADFPNTVVLDTRSDEELDATAALQVKKYQKHVGHNLTVQQSNAGTVLTYCLTCATIVEVHGREERC